MSNSQRVSKTELAAIHSKIIANGYNHNEKEADIIEIIGGIDEILSHYLNHGNDLLNSQQINQLHQLITTPSEYRQLIERDNNRKESVSQNEQFSLILQSDDTFLNSVFGQEIGGKINKFIWNKIIICLTFIPFVIGWSIEYILPNDVNHIVPRRCYWITYFLLIIPWLILCIMSINRVAAKRIAKTFEFNFKIYYAVIGIISLTVYQCVLLKMDQFYMTQTIIQYCLSGIVIMLLVILVFMMDGLQYNKARKVIMITVGFEALWFGYLSFKWEYLSFSDGRDPSIVEISSNIQFSLISIIAKSSRIISIFLFKQAFTLFYRMKKGEYKKSIFIKISPDLQWNGNGNNQHNFTQLQMIGHQYVIMHD